MYITITACTTTTTFQVHVSDSTRRSLLSLGSYSDKTFAATGPRQWNSFPVQLRNPDITYGLFRQQLKGHLFWEA